MCPLRHLKMHVPHGVIRSRTLKDSQYNREKMCHKTLHRKCRMWIYRKKNMSLACDTLS